MGELSILKEGNKETRISSVELVEIINQFRQLESETIGKECKGLQHKSFMGKIRTELETLKALGLNNGENFKKSSYINSQNKKQPCYLLNAQGIKFMLDSCRTRDKIPLSKVFNEISNGEEVSICKNKPEYEFIDGLINSLKPFGIEKYETQYIVNNSNGTNYRIDLYLPELNIAIEYDENNHNGYTYEKQEGRQKEIENRLGCKFFRVSDKNNLFYNIGYIIREITDALNSRNEKLNKELNLAS